MLEGGPAIDYFRRLAPDPRNTLAYVSYQVEGTLGNRIKNGLKEVSLFGPDGKIEMVKLRYAGRVHRRILWPFRFATSFSVS